MSAKSTISEIMRLTDVAPGPREAIASRKQSRVKVVRYRSARDAERGIAGMLEHDYRLERQSSSGLFGKKQTCTFVRNDP